MSHDQTEANLELVLDWIDALRRARIDSLADRFHPDVIWVDVAGSIACRGTRPSACLAARQPGPAAAGRRARARRRTTSTSCSASTTKPAKSSPALMHGQLFTVFTVDEGQIVQLRDFAQRAEALAEGGRGDHQ